MLQRRINQFYKIIVLLLINSYVNAAQVAYIGSDRAFIYADQELKSPIGYASHGKQVMVGNVPRQNGTILPVYVSKRIAYIQIKDLIFENKRMNSAQVLKKSNERRERVESLDRTSGVELLYNVFMLDSNWEQFLNTINETSTSNLTSFRISYQHFFQSFPVFIGAGAGYYSLIQDNVSIQNYSIEGSIYLSLLKFKYFGFDLNLSGQYIPTFLTQFGVGNEIINIEGSGFGYSVGCQIRLFPKSIINVVAGADYKLLLFSPSSKNENIDFNGTKGINYFSGLTLRF